MRLPELQRVACFLKGGAGRDTPPLPILMIPQLQLWWVRRRRGSRIDLLQVRWAGQLVDVWRTVHVGYHGSSERSLLSGTTNQWWQHVALIVPSEAWNEHQGRMLLCRYRYPRTWSAFYPQKLRGRALVKCRCAPSSMPVCTSGPAHTGSLDWQMADSPAAHRSKLPRKASTPHIPRPGSCARMLWAWQCPECLISPAPRSTQIWSWQAGNSNGSQQQAVDAFQRQVLQFRWRICVHTPQSLKLFPARELCAVPLSVGRRSRTSWSYVRSRHHAQWSEVVRSSSRRVACSHRWCHHHRHSLRLQQHHRTQEDQCRRLSSYLMRCRWQCLLSFRQCRTTQQFLHTAAGCSQLYGDQ